MSANEDKVRTEEQVEQGKKWVEDKFQDLAQQHNLPVKQLEWGADIDYQLRHSLVISTEAGAETEKFYEQDLADCPADLTVKAKLETKLSVLVEFLARSR